MFKSGEWKPRRELVVESHLVDIDEIRGTGLVEENRPDSGDEVAKGLMAGIALDLITGNEPHPEAIAALERRLVGNE